MAHLCGARLVATLKELRQEGEGGKKPRVAKAQPWAEISQRFQRFKDCRSLDFEILA